MPDCVRKQRSDNSYLINKLRARFIFFSFPRVRLAGPMYRFLPSAVQVEVPAAPSATAECIYSHVRRAGLTRRMAWAGVPDSAIMLQGRWYITGGVAKYTRGDAVRWLE